MLEQAIIAALSPLVGGRVWPLIGPIGAVPPYITFQQVGGEPSNTFCGNTDRLNARVQINVWSKKAMETTTIMLAAETVLTSSPIRGVSLGAFVAEYNEPTSYYGARQDFSFWR